MHLLPAALAPLADIAAKDEGKYAMTGIQLAIADKKYTAAATDGKRLLYITGPAPEATNYPNGPIHTAPNGQSLSIVPAKNWKEAFRATVALAKRNKGALVGDGVAVSISQDVTSFAAIAKTGNTFDQAKNIEGRFPPYKDIVPPAERARDYIDLDPWYLAGVLSAMDGMNTSEEHRRVRLEIHRNNNVVLRHFNEREKTEMTAVVVGLFPPQGEKDTRNDKCRATPAELRAQLDDSQAEIERLKQREGKLCDKLAKAQCEAMGLKPKGKAENDNHTKNVLKDKLAELEQTIAERDARIKELEASDRPDPSSPNYTEQWEAKHQVYTAEMLNLRKEYAVAVKVSDERYNTIESLQRTIQTMKESSGDAVIVDTTEVERLRKQVATLQAINANLVREGGKAGK